MPPAFNLSQDQTLQFNPSVCQFPLQRTSLSLKAISKEIYLRVSTSILSKLLHRTGVNSIPLTGQNQPGDNPLPVPAQRPKTTKHPHASAVYIVKERRRFPAAVSGEGRIIRIEIRGSTLFGFSTAKTACLATLRQNFDANCQDSNTRTNLRLPT
jgi:hypothetical protein